MQRWVMVSWALLAVVGAHQCPDGRRCEAGQTCCSDAADGFACCPFDEGVCCAGGQHCCPAHYRCDERETSCVRGEVATSWHSRLPAISATVQLDPRERRDVRCDEHNRCKYGETCCRMSATSWACCPFTNALCCMKQCCPTGYTCSDDGDCTQEDGTELK